MPSYANFQDFTNLGVALSAVWQRDVIETAAVASLFNDQVSGGAAERTKGVSRGGLVPRYNGAIEWTDVDPLDRATYQHEEYGDGIVISRKLMDDAEYNVMEDIMREHALRYTRTIAYHRASVFNNAFSSSYTGPDGKALCVTNHSSGTKPSFNNKGTAALTHDNLVTARATMRQWKDEGGNVILVNPDTLIVPVGLEATAEEIVASTLRSDNANNATNTNRRINLVVEPLLTDTNNWFLVDSAQSRRYLRWFWRVRPEMEIDPTSSFNLGLRMRGYMRYSFGWDTHTWVYGNEVA